MREAPGKLLGQVGIPKIKANARRVGQSGYSESRTKLIRDGKNQSAQVMLTTSVKIPRLREATKRPAPPNTPYPEKSEKRPVEAASF